MIKVTLPNKQMAYKMRKIYFYSHLHSSTLVRCTWRAAWCYNGWCSLFTLNLFHLSHFYLVSNFPKNDVKMIDVNFGVVVVVDDVFYVCESMRASVCWFWYVFMCLHFEYEHIHALPHIQIVSSSKNFKRKNKKMNQSNSRFIIRSFYVSSQHCIWYCAARTRTAHTLDTFSKHAYKVSNVCVYV